VVHAAVLLCGKARSHPTAAAVSAAVEVASPILAEPAEDLLVEAGRAVAAEEAEGAAGGGPVALPDGTGEPVRKEGGGTTGVGGGVDGGIVHAVSGPLHGSTWNKRRREELLTEPETDRERGGGGLEIRGGGGGGGEWA
jgi:hypothetical protein